MVKRSIHYEDPSLHAFHAGQRLALAGNIGAALQAFHQALWKHYDQAHSCSEWANYILATIAYL